MMLGLMRAAQRSRGSTDACTMLLEEVRTQQRAICASMSVHKSQMCSGGSCTCDKCSAFPARSHSNTAQPDAMPQHMHSFRPLHDRLPYATAACGCSHPCTCNSQQAQQPTTRLLTTPAFTTASTPLSLHHRPFSAQAHFSFSMHTASLSGPVTAHAPSWRLKTKQDDSPGTMVGTASACASALAEMAFTWSAAELSLPWLTARRLRSEPEPFEAELDEDEFEDGEYEDIGASDGYDEYEFDEYEYDEEEDEELEEEEEE